MTDKTAEDVPVKKLRLMDGRSRTSPPCAHGKVGQSLRIMFIFTSTHFNRDPLDVGEFVRPFN